MDTFDYDSVFSQFLHVCVTKTPHLDYHLTVSRPYSSIGVEGLQFTCTFRKGKNPI